MNRFLYILVLALSLISCSKSNPEHELLNAKYDFPILPGSEQWAEFTTGKQMYDACQIPENILKSITTKALAETCMDYPLFFIFTAYNYMNEGIIEVINNFNGLTELSKRDGCSKQLFDIYKQMSVPNLSNWTNTSEIYVFHILYLEMVMSADVFLVTFSDEELIKLQPLVKQKILERFAVQEKYSLLSYIGALHLYAKILKRQNTSFYKENMILINKIVQTCSLDPLNATFYIDFLKLIFSENVTL